jgi:hypothetical protein
MYPQSEAERQFQQEVLSVFEDDNKDPALIDRLTTRERWVELLSTWSDSVYVVERRRM